MGIYMYIYAKNPHVHEVASQSVQFARRWRMRNIANRELNVGVPLFLLKLPLPEEAACGKFRKLFPVLRRNRDIELKSNNAGKFLPTFLRAISDKTSRLFRNFIDLWDSDDAQETRRK